MHADVRAWKTLTYHDIVTLGFTLQDGQRISESQVEQLKELLQRAVNALAEVEASPLT